MAESEGVDLMVTADYLAKIRRAVRITQDDDFDEELEDIIEECRQDLIQLGVIAEKANDESDPVILGVIRCYARWKFPIDDSSAELNRNDFMILRDEIRRRVEYVVDEDPVG